MRAALASICALLACATDASAQSADDIPAVCRTGPAVDWQACLDATPPDAPWRPLVLINLGSDAFLRGDFAAAVRFYDDAIPDGAEVRSDIVFHTFRGASYWHVGRQDEARRDADLAWRMLHRDPSLPDTPLDYLPPGTDLEMVYVYLLPVWQSGDAARFDAALAEFAQLPARDWISYANRAAALQQIDRPEQALELSARAVAMAPNEPAALNNHCYILHTLERNVEALPFCERAAAGAPTAAAVRDSLSDVLAALGRCTEAEREIAEARRLDPSFPGYRDPIVCTPTPD